MTSISSSIAEHGWRLSHTYTQLPSVFYEKQKPEGVKQPRYALFNHPLAEALGLNAQALSAESQAAVLCGNLPLPGTMPIALAYAGHQYGYFTMLGDGRAVLLGEQVTPSGERYDLHLKGSGRTPFSRRGDGRAALGPMLREYIVSEAMDALGIPTTRSLAVITTGESVLRQGLVPGAILVRVAASHIRVGTFQYAAGIAHPQALQALADYTIWRHYPDCLKQNQPYLAFLQAVIKRQAALIAQWMCVGFIHGVMNTDNMTMSGETIDYGPCAFMDHYHPDTVFSSIDDNGRYAYANQPQIAQWNLTRFAETLLPLLHSSSDHAIALATEALAGFMETYQQMWQKGMRDKLGLLTTEAHDTVLIRELFDIMAACRADFTVSFRRLSLGEVQAPELQTNAAYMAWHVKWQRRIKRQAVSFAEVKAHMLAHNPARVPRNHQVETAIQAAEQYADYTQAHRLLEAIRHPYEATPQYAEYDLPPTPEQRIYQTFCGT